MFLDERVDVSGIEIENVVAVRYECTTKRLRTINGHL